MDPAAGYILKEVGSALDRIPDKSISSCIEMVMKARRTFVFGVGRSGLVGQAFAVRLVQLGLDVHFVGDTTTPIVQENDLLIAISNTGETMSAVQTANIVRRLGASVIVITGRENSKLAHAANLIILVREPSDRSKSKQAPLGTIFEDGAMIFLDGLIPLLMGKLNQTENDMRGRHAIWV
ncbi:MAG: 6-phospho-3-hexuloisomerase [Methanobacteriota archaeon]